MGLTGVATTNDNVDNLRQQTPSGEQGASHNTEGGDEPLSLYDEETPTILIVKAQGIVVNGCFVPKTGNWGTWPRSPLPEREAIWVSDTLGPASGARKVAPLQESHGPQCNGASNEESSV